MIGQLKTQNIFMIKGNTKSFTIRLTTISDTGEKVQLPFENGDIVRFTAKKDLNQTTPDISKEVTSFTNGDAIITLQPSDTASLDIDVYQYDFQWDKHDDNVYTFLTGTLTVALSAGVNNE